jgi:hypothetical protein
VFDDIDWQEQKQELMRILAFYEEILLEKKRFLLGGLQR